MKVFSLNNIFQVPRQWLSRYKSYSNLAIWLALGYLLFILVSIPALYKTEPFESLIPPSSTVSEVNVTQSLDYQLIKEWHLFGESTVLLSHETGDIKASDLPIKLLGVFLLPNQDNKSYAIIENEDKTQIKYRVGDQLPNGGIIQSIEKEQVILLNNQQTESLSIERNRTGLLFITE